MGGVGLQGTVGGAVSLRQYIVKAAGQLSHGDLRRRQLSRPRHRCPGAQQTVPPLQPLQLRRRHGAGQIRERQDLRGGAKQHPGPRCRQLLSQGPQQRGFSPTADDSGDAGTDAQQSCQFHGSRLLSFFFP